MLELDNIRVRVMQWGLWLCMLELDNKGQGYAVGVMVMHVRVR